jgi:hypothetical protein
MPRLLRVGLIEGDGEGRFRVPARFFTLQLVRQIVYEPLRAHDADELFVGVDTASTRDDSLTRWPRDTTNSSSTLTS